jgi:drug/metabolite transporter (DMT)-like permease
VRLERLTRGHVVAAVAALALLLVMAMDWYGSTTADLAHQLNKLPQTSGAQAGEAGSSVKEDADRVIARDEKNAWQEQRSVDRVLLVFLLLSVFVPLFAAAYRAAGKRASPPWTPSLFAALSAAIAALLLAYRIVNEPGNDVTTTVKLGAPLGLVLLGVIGLGAVAAFQREADAAETDESATLTGEPAAPDAAPDSPDAPATS